MDGEKESICLKCLYGSQPLGYYPIVCVFDEIKEMWEDKFKCKHFEPVPEDPPPPEQTPWQVIITNE